MVLASIAKQSKDSRQNLDGPFWGAVHPVLNYDRTRMLIKVIGEEIRVRIIDVSAVLAT
jgi:hypothetical protein